MHYVVPQFIFSILFSFSEQNLRLCLPSLKSTKVFSKSSFERDIYNKIAQPCRHLYYELRGPLIIGPLQLVILMVQNRHAREQKTHWEKTNKGNYNSKS